VASYSGLGATTTPEYWIDGRRPDRREGAIAERERRPLILRSLFRCANVLSAVKGLQARGDQRRRQLKATIFISPRSRETDLLRAEAALKIKQKLCHR